MPTQNANFDKDIGQQIMDPAPLDIVLFGQTCRTQYERDSFEAMLSGFRTSGDTATFSDSSYTLCDVAVVAWSPRLGDAPSTRACRYIRNLHPKNLLIVEMPIFRGTKEWYSRLGFDHVHGSARFPHNDVSYGRFEKLGLKVMPWRSEGNVVIVASQVQDDYSLDGIDVDEWACDVANFISNNCDAPVVIRPHPLGDRLRPKAYSPSSKVEISELPLEKDLERAWRWVSYTSGSSIEAVLAGVPSITLSRNNFAWDVSSHDLRNINQPNTPDRRDWLSRLAYCQWNSEEVASGEAWRHLRPLVA